MGIIFIFFLPFLLKLFKLSVVFFKHASEMVEKRPHHVQAFYLWTFLYGFVGCFRKYVSAERRQHHLFLFDFFVNEGFGDEGQVSLQITSLKTSATLPVITRNIGDVTDIS